jgi:hypothetical protein
MHAFGMGVNDKIQAEQPLFIHPFVSTPSATHPEVHRMPAETLYYRDIYMRGKAVFEEIPHCLVLYQ